MVIDRVACSRVEKLNELNYNVNKIKNMLKYFSSYNNKKYTKAEVNMMLKIKNISGLSRLSSLQILRNKLDLCSGEVEEKEKNIFINLNIQLNKAKSYEDIKKIFY